jgi:hypothetical protein
MAYYRLYFIDPRRGHIAAFEEIEAEGDDHAIAAAEKYRGWQPLELWCGGKKVHRVEADVFATPRAVAEAAAGLR